MRDDDPPSRLTDHPEEDLGPLIFAGKPNLNVGVVFATIGVLFTVPGLALLFFDPNPRTPMIAGLELLVASIFIVIGVVYLLPRVGSVFFFHERGVRHVLRGRLRVLRYEDIAELTFNTQWIYYNGVYLGSPARLTIRSYDRHEKPFIINQGRYERSTRGEQPPPSDLHKVCFHIAAILAARLGAHVERGQDVEWTDKMRIHAHGIEVRDGTIIIREGKWVPNLVPWDKVAAAEIAGGLFLLLVEGEKRYRVIVETASPNFYPGYLYVLKRVSQWVNVSSLPEVIAQRVDVQG
jgi:hypothetical protein